MALVLLLPLTFEYKRLIHKAEGVPPAVDGIVHKGVHLLQIFNHDVYLDEFFEAKSMMVSGKKNENADCRCF